MKDSKKIFNYGESNRHNRSIKFRTVQEMYEPTLIAYIREAVKVNEKGIKIKEKKVGLPSDLKKAISKNQKAKKFYEKLSYTYQKEYAGWIEKAKREETRIKRIQQAVKRLARGQKFN